MAHSTRTVPIIAASVIAVLLVGGAYVLSGPIPFINTVGAESTEELLKAYAAKDTDGDDLPDWQEALYGTDPENPESFQAGMTDGEAVAQGLLTPKPVATDATETEASFPGTDAAPGSLTDQFAKKFFERYLTGRSSEPPTEAEVASFVNEAVADLVSTATTTTFYTLKDASITSDTSDAALIAYATAASNAILANAVPAEEDELVTFVDAVENGDADSLKKVRDIAGGYRAIGQALIKVPVPSSAAAAHVRLANVLMNLNASILRMVAFSDDPIRAMIAVGEYSSFRDELIRAFAATNASFSTNGLVIEEGGAGYHLYRMGVKAIPAAAEIEAR